MKTLFVVNQGRGVAWDVSKPIRWQSLWDEHAAFMDQLTADGFIVLGGPLGDPEGEAMLVVAAPDEETVKVTLAKDPWRDSGHLIEPKFSVGRFFSRRKRKGTQLSRSRSPSVVTFAAGVRVPTLVGLFIAANTRLKSVL